VRPSSAVGERRPIGWRDALIAMMALLAVLWAIEIVDSTANLNLDQYGLRPRDIEGLRGIITSPFLHAGYGHLFANSVPFVLIGWVVLLSGVRPFLLSSAIIIVVGGVITWLVAPSVGPHGAIVGASGLILGWLGYLLGRAFFSRRVMWIVVAIGVVFFFGALLGSLLPSVDDRVSWQGHVAGFVAGVFAAWLLHPNHRQRRRRQLGRTTSPASVADRAPESTPPPQALS
jgi:membrane associated rhomboid family serine protease